MAYTITRSNGSTITVSDNALDTTYSVTLVGKNRTNYGAPLNQNFFRLMENFASGTAPVNPQAGQLWWNTTQGVLNVWSGTAWKPVSSITTSATAPGVKTQGDLWFDTFNNQLKVWNGSRWFVIGPVGTTLSGVTGFVTESPVDQKFVASIYSGDIRIAVISAETISPANQTEWAGFTPQIRTGLNFNTSYFSSGIGVWNGNVGGDTAAFTGASVTANVITSAGNVNAARASISGNVVAGNVTVNNTLSTSSLTLNALTVNSTAAINSLSVGAGSTLNTVVAVSGLVSSSWTANTITANLGVVTGNLSVSRTANLGVVGNVKITGGSTGQVLSTDGTGNLSWITPAEGGGTGSGTVNSGVASRLAYYPSTGTVVDDTANLTWNGSNLLTVTGTVSATRAEVGTFAASGNANLTNAALTGVLSAGATSLTSLVVTGNITGNNATVNNSITTASLNTTTLTAVGNVAFSGTVTNLGNVTALRIGQGTAGYVLTAVGDGTVNWSEVSGGGGNTSGTINSGTTTHLAVYTGSTTLSGATGANGTVSWITTSSPAVLNIGNIGTPASLVVTGTTSTGNTSVTGFVTATGNISGGNISSTGLTTTNTANITATTAATSTTTGALRLSGGAGIAGNVYVGGLVSVTGNVSGGNIIAAGDVISSSDARIKTNLKPIEDALALVTALTGYKYTRTDMQTDQFGLIAQDVEKILPEMVQSNDGLLGISYIQLIAILIEAVKQLNEKVNQCQRD